MSNVPGVRDKPVRGYQRRQRAGVYFVNYVGWTAGKATTIQSSARKAPRDHALGVSLRRRHGIPLAPITRRSPLRPILSWNEVRNERIHSPSNIDVLIDSSTVPLSKGQPSSLMTQSSNHNSNIWIHEHPSNSLQEKKKGGQKIRGILVRGNNTLETRIGIRRGRCRALLSLAFSRSLAQA